MKNKISSLETSSMAFDTSLLLSNTCGSIIEKSKFYLQRKICLDSNRRNDFSLVNRSKDTLISGIKAINSDSNHSLLRIPRSTSQSQSNHLKNEKGSDNKKLAVKRARSSKCLKSIDRTNKTSKNTIPAKRAFISSVSPEPNLLAKEERNLSVKLLKEDSLKHKISIKLLKTKSSNWIVLKTPDIRVIKSPFKDGNYPINNNKKSNETIKTPNEDKSDIEKLIESQAIWKERNKNKFIEIHPINNEAHSEPILESRNSEISDIKSVAENNTERSIPSYRVSSVSHRTSRFRIARKVLNSNDRSKRPTAREEKVLRDIMNYESLVENIREKSKKDPLIDGQAKKLKQSIINDENYKEISLEVLKDTSFFAEKIMKQIRNKHSRVI
ncbi:unnamed protein product [Blepharisma stoltei]|uniref:Uncharacterized protein n=1 Tax=Blepharisma stoltei TaxID=1481888 RepID=A0AAU9IPR8_9CILI|nr:unnamed protein product [Blepharisma stoltei]